MRVPMKRVPHAIASSITLGNPSLFDGSTTASAAEYQRGKSASGSAP
jgi:hypothetical protein